MSNLSVQLKQEMNLPLIMAPMFLVSSPKMVIEGCKGGVIGSFPLLNARTTEILEDWMIEIKEELDLYKQANPTHKVAPWAVNIIVHRTNKRYEADLELIKKHQPPIVITSLGDPSPVISVVHEYGGLVFADVISIHHSKRAIAKGVDGLILVCNGAGGHAGTLNPFAFLSAVREFWDGLTILAGCISNGNEILAAEALGADFVYMGTRFIPTKESLAVKDYQQMLIDSTLEDLIYTDSFSGVHANYLIPSIKKAGIDPEKLQRKEEADFSKLNQTGSKAWRDIWSAGQGVNSIKQVQTVNEVILELESSYVKTARFFKGRETKV